MRFHLIDRIETVCYGKYITAVKCVTLADDVFNEHFPGYPIFPGTLILEGLAQLGGSFFELMMKEQGLPPRRAVLTIVTQMKFKKPAGPGDRLEYRADLAAMKDDFGVVKVAARLEGEPCAEGELMFSFVDIPNQRLHDSRLAIYDICMKNARIVTDEGHRQ
jgi:3-hydroxyacyl-[acyl-carrier-protein] dehydratase